MEVLRVWFSGHLEKKCLLPNSLIPSMFSSDYPNLPQIPQSISSILWINNDGTLFAFVAGALGRNQYCTSVRVSLIKLLRKIMHF